MYVKTSETQRYSMKFGMAMPQKQVKVTSPTMACASFFIATLLCRMKFITMCNLAIQSMQIPSLRLVRLVLLITITPPTKNSINSLRTTIENSTGVISNGFSSQYTNQNILRVARDGSQNKRRIGPARSMHDTTKLCRYRSSISRSLKPKRITLIS